MKFTCLQENLLKGLSTVSKAVPLRSPLPILSNVLVTAADGRLQLGATDLDTSITTYVGAAVEEDGAITVPAKLLQEFVSHLSPDTIAATLKSDILHLSSGKTVSRFNGTSADDFPEMPVLPEGTKFPKLEIDPRVLNSAVGAVAFAASAEGGRPILSGILLKYSKNVLTVAATDGYRLSEKFIKLKGKVEDFSVVVPAKTLLEASKIFSSSEEPIKMLLNADENRVLFASEEVLVSTGILDGEYPDYKRIIPTESVLNASFRAADLLEAVRLTNVFAKEDSIIKMVFDPEGVVRVMSSSEEAGENKSEIEAVIEGESVEIAFNSKYLLDFLGNVKVENIIFETGGSITPGIIRSEDFDDYMHLVMPVRVRK